MTYIMRGRYIPYSQVAKSHRTPSNYTYDVCDDRFV